MLLTIGVENLVKFYKNLYNIFINRLKLQTKCSSLDVIQQKCMKYIIKLYMFSIMVAFTITDPKSNIMCPIHCM